MTRGVEQGKAKLLPSCTHPRTGPLRRPSTPTPAAAVFLGQEEMWLKKKPQGEAEGAGKAAPELTGRPSTAKVVTLGRVGLCTCELPSKANSRQVFRREEMQGCLL